MSLFEELKRRNVIRVAVAYVVTAWLVAQVAELGLEAFEAPAWALKLVILLLFLGLPFALGFAWVYELTPEGIRRESEVERAESITAYTGRKLDRLVILVLALIIALMAGERWLFGGLEPEPSTVEVPGPGPEPDAPAPSIEEPAALQAHAGPPEKSVSVLPFADLSQAQDQEWFADGLAEEILNALARTPDLMVSSRTSSFRYKKSELGIPDIATELGVAHVLEGSVRRSGDRIRVTAQLIRASDGFHLWSQNYDRDAADVIEIQEDLARSIATALETTMDPESLAEMSAIGTRSVEAYNEYIRGRAAVSQESRQPQQDLRDAYAHFERARTVDPGFYQAHLEAAEFWQVQLDRTHLLTGAVDVPAREMLANFNSRIDAAIASARSDVDRRGYQARKAMVELRIRDAIGLMKDYVAARPGDREGWTRLMKLSQWSNDPELAREVIDHWWRLAQTSDTAAFEYAAWAYRVIEPESAADAVIELLQRWPNRPGLMYQAHRTLLWAGRTQEAAAVARRFLETGSGVGAGILLARQGCAEGDQRLAEEALAGLGPRVVERWHVLMLLGREDEAVDVIRPLAESGIPSQMGDFLDYHQFDPRPFPALVSVLERERIDRPLPVKIPFACQTAGDVAERGDSGEERAPTADRPGGQS